MVQTIRISPKSKVLIIKPDQVLNCEIGNIKSKQPRVATGCDILANIKKISDSNKFKVLTILKLSDYYSNLGGTDILPNHELMVDPKWRCITLDENNQFVKVSISDLTITDEVYSHDLLNKYIITEKITQATKTIKIQIDTKSLLLNGIPVYIDTKFSIPHIHGTQWTRLLQRALGSKSILVIFYQES